MCGPRLLQLTPWRPKGFRIGDERAVTVWRMSGLHAYQFFGMPAGNPAGFKGIDVLRAGKGEAVEQPPRAVQRVQ